MKKTIFCTFVLLEFLCFVFSACQKEEAIEAQGIQEETACSTVSANTGDVLVYNGKPMRWEMSKSISLSKGKNINSCDWFDFANSIYGLDIDTSSCRYANDPSVRYKTLKVYRRNSTKYFYVMIENLDIPWSSGCYSYKNNDIYVSNYGRLYTWGAANTIASNFKMDLEICNSTGSRVLLSPYTVSGHLPTMEDILDIMEADSICHLPQYGKSMEYYYDNIESYKLYYDAFVFGIETASGNPAGGYHTLAGGRNGTYGVPELDLYSNINKEGYYWTSATNGYATTAHYHFRVLRQDNYNTYDYVAFINFMLENNCGCSVRYVFEPKYMNIP